MTSLVGPNSIIQTDFVYDGTHGNLAAVLFIGGQIQHWSGVPGNNAPMIWSGGAFLPAAATGPASIIQSSLGSSSHGDFEVVLLAADGLWHWKHDNSNVFSPWIRVGLVSAYATGPGSIIQSTLGPKGYFEVVVPEGNELWHYSLNTSDPAATWQRIDLVVTGATGPGRIIQSNLGSPGNFEVVVLEGNQLWHHWLDNSNPSKGWQRAGLVSSNATGPGCIIQSNLGSPGNFEVVVLEGNNLVHHWHDNSDVTSAWQNGKVVSVAATGPGSIIQSNYGPGGQGNFEVLAQELTQSVVHYWFHNVDPNLPWWRGPRLRTEVEIDAPPNDQSIKISQVTGDYDRQLKEPTLSLTASKYGVVGTDLGASFQHAGRICFLFGDTRVDGNIRGDPDQDLDTVAFTATKTPDKGIVIACNFAYPKVNNIDQTTFCVPCDGVSVPSEAALPTSTAIMYVFFTTDRINDPGTGAVSMGRCVLARSSDDGLSFGSTLFDLSTDKFINLSLQIVENDTISGLPQRFGQGLLIWATGQYRASNAYLGYVPLASIEDRSAYLFYAGLSSENLPIWVADEAQAQALFLSGNMGELCVRWNPFLREFIMAYNSDNGGSILARQSATPWGPWTGPESIFNLGAAMGSTGFLNNPAINNGQGDPDATDAGTPYAPYFIQPYTRQNADQSTTMYYLVSLHNPYQVALMSVQIRSRALVSQSPKTPPPESGPFRGPGSIHDPAGR